MTLTQFAIATGADPKWVKNALSALHLPGAYSEQAACRLGLARVIHTSSGLPLKRAYELATGVLSSPVGVSVISEASDASVQVTVDVERYLSTFRLRMAAARRYQERGRGRRGKAPADPIAFAREYGIDISLLESNLRRTPEERLRTASANSDFIRSFRGSAAR